MSDKNRKSDILRKTTALMIFFLIIQNISAYTWKPVVTPAGGAIQDIVYSKLTQGLIYMRTDMGGAYRWDNANNVWVPLTDWLGDWNLYGVESIAPDPKNANLVYAAIGQSYNNSNGYLIVSSDQGNNWIQYPMPVIIAGNDSGNYAGERLAVDPDNTAILYYGSRSGGLWKSTNSGVNWSQVTSFPVNGDSGHGLSYVIFDPNSATGSGCNNIYVGVMALNSGNSNIYRSTNGGASWSLISGGPSGMSTSQASLGSDSNLWIVYNNDNSGPTTGQVWKLNIGTLAWNSVTPSGGPPATAGGYSGICVDAQNAQHAVISTMDWWGGTDKCFQTTNGGNSWTVIANTQNNWNSGPYPNYDINGAPWTRFCSPYNGGAWLIASVKIDPFNSNNAIYTTGGGIWSTKNVQATTQPQGITWTFTDYGIEQTAVLFLCPSYKSGVFFSCLGDISGMRYTNLDSPAPDKYCNPAFGNTSCLDFDENNTNYVARVGKSGSVASDTAFSSDNGQSWAPASIAPPGYSTSNEMQSVAVAADASNFRVIVCPISGYGNPAYTTDGGGSWTTCNGLPSGSDLAADRVNASIIFATNGSNLYRSLDGGANFSVINSFSGSGVPRAVFGVTGEVWVATGNGLYRFANNGLIKAVISNVSSANSVGFGKAASGQTHPAVYLTGNVGGTYGFYRCDDGTGTSWVRINDNNHQYGYGAWCGGDQDIYGRMYVGTNGRGTLYCDSAPAGTATPTTTGTPPTATLTQTITRTPTITPTFTGTPMQCNGWIYTGETPYNLASGGSYIGTSGTVSEVTTQYHSASHSMDINFVWSDGYYQGMGYNWANWNTSSSSIYNASSATAIDLWLLSGSGTITTLSISLVDSSGANSNSIPVTNYLTGGVTTSWQELKIPLSSFTGVNLTALWELNITTGGSQSGNQTIYLDDFSFLLPCGTPTNTVTQTKTVTPTVVNSPTMTVTATGTSTQTATRTFTATSTNSFTPSPTLTFSRTPTIVNTATDSPTNTWTITTGATATNTLTATGTPLLTATYTGTATYTATNTPTATISQTDTVSPTVTESCTGTPPTATLSYTDTPTQINSPTPTVTNTVTSTPTTVNTPSFTATPTETETIIFTYTATATITQTCTETTVPANTWTFTLTITLTPAITATDTIIPTKTITPSFTQTLTMTITVAVTPTFTPTAMETREIVYPNPYDPSKGDLNIIYNVSDQSDTVKIRIFTRAFRLVLEENLYPTAAGINKGAIRAGFMNGFANGIYFYSVFSSDKNGNETEGIINKVIILR
jgi:hypothetical protein